jgi:transposase InsO family protein
VLIPDFLKRTLEPFGQFLLGKLRAWTKPCTQTPLVGAVTDLARSKSSLILENALLRQQLIVLKRQVKRPKLTWRDRALFVVLASRLKRWKEALLIVKPETLLRWHRDLFRRVWRRKSSRQAAGGRPALASDQVVLIRRLATENRTWGAERIRGELLKLGAAFAKSTIQKYLKGRRRVPGPGSQTWGTCLRNHASAIWACDFVQTYDVLFRAIFVFAIIELGLRRVVHIAVTRHPDDAWVAQQLREATPFGTRPQYLIRDNDSKYGSQFDKVLRTPIAAPKANAVCECFVGSLRRECLDYLFILGERHLLTQVKAYVVYFNQARPHQGIDQRILAAPARLGSPPVEGTIVRLPIRNDLHHDYQRRVA